MEVLFQLSLFSQWNKNEVLQLTMKVHVVEEVGVE